MPLTRAVSRFLQPLLALGVLAVVVGLGSYQAFLRREVAQVAEFSQLRLEFYRRTLAQTLEEFRLLPNVLGLDGRVRGLLANGRDGERVAAVNRYLEEVSQDPVIHVTYLLDAGGKVLAASNWREATSFVGKNYSFRPYFHDAMSGRPGRFFGVGVTTLEAGYFLSAPVYVDGVITGVAVVKIRLDALEDAWRRSGDLLLVADRLGVVVLASSPSWKFRSLFPLAGADRDALARTRQYLDADLPLLLATDGEPILRPDGSGRRLALAGRALPFVAADGQAQALLSESIELPDYDWRLIILSDLTDARKLATVMAAALTLALLLLGMAIGLWHTRRRRTQERRAARAALEQVQADLEARIAERTAELVTANRTLEERVGALKDAEQILTRTRDTAVQAGKLAVLGQMAAGVTHELNQPLAALTTLADNARRFIERDKPEAAAENLGHIARVAQRMGRIVAQLKTFSRKSGDVLAPVDVADAIDNALLLVESRRQGADVSVTVRHATPGLTVKADITRLEQVVVNLAVNAMDAMAGASVRELSIETRSDGGEGIIRLRDTGGGIDPQVWPHLFEPFFTTKPIGKGLGLGLAISRLIAESLHGSLSAANDDGGGACFELRLPLARGGY
ncbi:ATP-binding protein [Zoogloeaceae bacterium G21618-S1]|nr:ATP-binding protein [Zoogloeaceae bacterium G21618-S1]